MSGARLSPFLLGAAAIFVVAGAGAADPFADKFSLSNVNDLLGAGRYEEARELAEEAVTVGWRNAGWQRARIEALLATGGYEEAGRSAVALAEDYSRDLPMLIFVHDVLERTGRTEDAAVVLAFVNDLATVSGEGAEDFDAHELVALGRAALGLGADAKLVLERFFGEARRRAPHLLDGHLAAAELAIEKSDPGLAAEILREAGDGAAQSADAAYWTARAFQGSDGEVAERALKRALSLNPRHFPSLVLLAEEAIDGGEYGRAREHLATVLGSDPHHSGALALMAAAAFLENDLKAHAGLREKALSYHAGNPEVDHAIGVRVSRKRRFDEGRQFQEQALAYERRFLPAMLALAFDHLRLGDEETAWRLAEEVHEADGYNVLAFNLVTLRDHLKGFKTLEEGGFVVRMVPVEAEVYGRRVLDRLIEAKDVLCRKYGVELESPVLVEFFPQQQDFAVRTFGIPGGAGILGACFGSVVTMNSPGGTGALDSNWEATLWHEFCHVVTLSATLNRMPRWLSEGISVYEETLRDARWGQAMSAGYREAILEGDGIVPLARMEAAFTDPDDPTDIMFAYFLSGLAVEHMVERFGEAALRDILRDLSDGVPIEDAVAARMAPWDEVESSYADFVRGRAEAFGRGLTWEKPGEDDAAWTGPEAAEAFYEANPDSYWALKLHATNLLEAERAAEALPLLGRLLEAVPEDVGPGNPYALMARVHRQLGDEEAELEVLRRAADVSADASSIYQRLMDVELENGRWDAAAAAAEAQLAVNPMVRSPYRCLGTVCQHKGQHREAVGAFGRLLALGPVDPAAVRYALAESHEALNEPGAAKRHILDALAEAPRFVEGHRMLLRLRGAGTTEGPTDAP